MSIIHSFPNHTHNGISYGFDHLKPQKYIITAKKSDDPSIIVRISFHSHVFSFSQKPSGTHSFHDENGRGRTFCPDRYAKSRTLPQMCADMLDKNHLTWISKDKNRVSNLAVIGNALVSGIHYTVVYYLYPSQSDAFDVELVVKSAYDMDINFSYINRRYNTLQQVRTCYYQKKKVP